MKKFYKIITLILLLIFLTTYTPNTLFLFKENENSFFKITNIEITNNKKIEKKEIIDKLNHIYNKNILLVSANDIEEPLRKLDFLDNIKIKKKYPNTILIEIYETKPVAVLFKKNNKYIIDNLSKLTNYDDNLNQNNLPSVFGKDAEKDLINFINQLENNSFPKHKIKNYYYFQINRWDLMLKNEQLIKFPSKKRKQAIQQSVELLNRKDFKNYKVIDLRIHGKIVVE